MSDSDSDVKSYNGSVDTATIENVMLIHSAVEELNTYVNSNTFEIVYNTRSSRDEILRLLRSKFSNSNIKRIGIAFHYSDSEVFFLDNEKLFTVDDLAENTTTYSNNVQFMLDIINEFNVTHVDYLACNTLENENYKKYYDILISKTNVVVGASEDKTGNIKYGGDWVLESTQEDVQNIYFTNEIVNYADLLALTIYSFGHVNYQYDPAVTTKTASVTSSSSATGFVTILASFVVNGVYYNVTSIGTNAFQYCTGLTSVVIPSSVTSIGGNAFLSCTGLQFVWIPYDLLNSTGVNSTAFSGCSNLGTNDGDCIYSDAAVSPSGNNLYTSTGAQFYGTQQLVRVRMATILIFNTSQNTTTNSTIIINNNTYTANDSNKQIFSTTGANSVNIERYSDKTQLTNVLLRNSSAGIAFFSFEGCSALTFVSIPSSVTSIPDFAFGTCTALTSITIPSSVTSIGNNAFQYCTGLTSVTIPSSVTSIKEFAFNNCRALTSITIPSSVTSIGSRAFLFCSSLHLNSVTTDLTTATVYTNGIANPTNPQIHPAGYYSNFYDSKKAIQVNVVITATPAPTVNPQTPTDNPICVLQ